VADWEMTARVRASKAFARVVACRTADSVLVTPGDGPLIIKSTEERVPTPIPTPRDTKLKWKLLIAILLPPVGARVPVAFLSVLIALVLTGTVSAILGGARKRRAVLRVVLGGALAMLVTYGIGQMVGTTI